jgi:hypothetical protein
MDLQVEPSGIGQARSVEPPSPDMLLAQPVTNESKDSKDRDRSRAGIVFIPIVTLAFISE